MSKSAGMPTTPGFPRSNAAGVRSPASRKGERQRARSGPAAGSGPVARSGAAASSALEQRILLTATLCLLAFGMVMVYSASSASTVLQGGSGSTYLIKFAAYGAGGLVVMRLLAKDGIARVEGIVAPLLVASFVLVLAVHLPGIGVSVNGARRWVGRGPLVFQPSELMKLALVLYSATLLARRPQRVMDLKDLSRPLLIVVGSACALVISQPDIGTAMVIAFTVAALLVAAGIPMRNLAIIAGTLLALVALVAIAMPYARARLTSFINPWAHAKTSGFQAVQGQIAIGSGGLFGVGPGQSVQKIFYLPEAPTDFILAVIGEELGVTGICALLSLYGLIAYAGLRIAKKARSLHSALIAVGITSMIVSEAALNVFSVLGLAPLTGVPLPFVSYGASSLVVMLASMGLLMNVAAGGSAHVRAVPDLPSRRPRRQPGVEAPAARTQARSAGGAASWAVADARGREQAGWWDERGFATADRDRGGRDRGSRRARARGR